MVEYTTYKLQSLKREVKVLKDYAEIAQQLIDLALNSPEKIPKVLREYPSLSNPGILDRVRRLMQIGNTDRKKRVEDALYLRVAIRGLEQITGSVEASERAKVHQSTSDLIELVVEVESGF